MQVAVVESGTYVALKQQLLPVVLCRELGVVRMMKTVCLSSHVYLSVFEQGQVWSCCAVGTSHVVESGTSVVVMLRQDQATS